MPSELLHAASIEYRNFNLCPHCIRCGEAQPLLSRLCEGMPMISRSDGKTFHLLLADRPSPYPAERDMVPAGQISAYFWYSHVQNPNSVESVVVILQPSSPYHHILFRQIEEAADLLAAMLLSSRRLATMYEYSRDSLRELPC